LVRSSTLYGARLGLDELAQPAAGSSGKQKYPIGSSAMMCSTHKAALTHSPLVWHA
jgi:hypothetical protein